MKFREIQFLSLVSILLVGCGGGGGGTNQFTPTLKANQAPAPTITFTATPLTIGVGSSTTLSWTSSNATSVTIDNGIGAVALSDSRQVSPGSNATYIATATGAGGGVATASVNVTVVPKPTISIVINPSTVKAGSTATLTWNSSNATSVTFDNDIGSVPPSGSRPVTPADTTSYTATATGLAGSVTASASVDVVFPPTLTFSATPASIIQGGSTSLSWTSSNADSVSIDNNLGVQPANGSVIVSPKSTTAYVATATGPGGTVSSTFKVDVSNAPPPTVSITATPETISAGQAATLAWT
jgi:hypothetical protein